MPNLDTSWSKTLRLASVEDLPEVLRLYREMHAENGMFPLSERRVVEALSLHFQRTNRGHLGVVPADGVKAPPGGKLKAMVYLVLSNVYYSEGSDGAHWSDLFLYCDPSHRKERIAPELLRFAKYICEASGLPGLISIMSSRAESKMRLYQRVFGKPAGCTFVLNAPPSWKNEPSNINPFAEPQRIRGGRKHKANRRSAEQLNGGAEHHG